MRIALARGTSQDDVWCAKIRTRSADGLHREGRDVCFNHRYAGIIRAVGLCRVAVAFDSDCDAVTRLREAVPQPAGAAEQVNRHTLPRSE